MIKIAIENYKFEKFAGILSKDVLDKLTGVHDDFDRMLWHDPPSKNILIGNLYGVKELKEKELEDFRLVNSLSVKFLLDDFNSDVAVDFEFSVYYRVYPTFKEQSSSKLSAKKGKFSMMRVWKRKKVEGSVIFDKTIEEYSISSNISSIIGEIKNDENCLRKDSKIPESFMESESKYNNFIEKEKKVHFSENFSWDCYFNFKNRKFTQNAKDYTLVEINFINDTFIDNEIKLFDTTVFNPNLKISLNDNKLHPFVYKTDGGIYKNDIRCLNCQGDFDSNSNSISTFNYAIFNQEKIVPINSLKEADISFDILSKKEGLIELEKIYSKMEDFYKNSEDSSEKEEFHQMMERFKSNINFLKSDENSLKAFQLMNKTFKRNSNYDGWRLFQIVFIVSQIMDIVLADERETCELLHVMTGGGKSETYFGIVIFTAFYDRLDGKEFGISAITKFPLRMLSIQQLQRISNIFINAEQIRREENIGGDEFSIAYFVGGQDSDFPNYNHEVLLKINKAQKKNEKIKGKIIDTCPLCHGDVFLDIDKEKQVVIHKCDSCGEEFRLYYIDDEIYRTLPTFIVSTVDKWAGIATNRRFRNLLGGNLEECSLGHGFMPAFDTCGLSISEYKKCDDNGRPVSRLFDTSPTLVIQDEMHLIKEGFGTIDSHFESLMEAMKSEFSNGSKFKNIVMTATVKGAETQIKHLYYKDTRVFPPTLKDTNGNTFFFKKQKDDGKNVLQRRIIGLKPSILSYRVIFYILRYIAQFIKKLESNIEDFSLKYDFALDELIEIKNYYKKLLTYHNKKEAAHNVTYSIDDYVNNHKDNYKVQVKALTGDNDLDDIKEVMNTIEHFYEDEMNKEKLFAVNATSIVSHGVDIDEWNIMVFDGMPRSTSEYIQALSRVGRKYFGLVFVIFSATKTRDLSFYQHFNEYHSMLDEKVENVPLSRWAKLGFKQTFTSVFSAALLNYLPNVIEELTYNPDMAKRVLQVENNKKLLIDFIKKAYISDSNMLGADYFEKEIEKEYNRRAEYLINNTSSAKLFTNALIEYNDKYFKTQYGMRGIQDEIKLIPIGSDTNFRASLRGDK